MIHTMIRERFESKRKYLWYRYNSLWYDMPPKYQKMLLPILMKTAEEYRFTVGGLFSPCYEGFTTVINQVYKLFTKILTS